MLAILLTLYYGTIFASPNDHQAAMPVIHRVPLIALDDSLLDALAEKGSLHVRGVVRTGAAQRMNWEALLLQFVRGNEPISSSDPMVLFALGPLIYSVEDNVIVRRCSGQAGKIECDLVVQRRAVKARSQIRQLPVVEIPFGKLPSGSYTVNIKWTIDCIDEPSNSSGPFSVSLPIVVSKPFVPSRPHKD
jgi:hypothetical protein